MNDTLFDMTPYKSEASMSYRPDWIDATVSDPAWDVPDTEPNIETRTDGPDGNAPSGWLFKSEFIITLKSGQTVEVKFVPGIEGELSMHQFDFTGSVSPTGNKTHFVLAVESESGWATPADYAQAYAQGLVAQLKSKKHSSLNKKRTRSVATAQAPQELTADNDNSTLEPTMAENETTDSSHAPVEVVEELSPDEAADRQRLELKVERAFYEAGVALRELRDRRLYRSSHRSFEAYCQDRFGFNRISAHNRIAAAEVLENLFTIGEQIPLPTNERQVRPIASLAADEQRQVWQEAVEASNGKVPSGRMVKGIVERMKEKHLSLASDSYNVGDIFTLKGLSGSERKYNGCWAIAISVNEFTLKLEVHDATITVKPDNLNSIDSPDERRQLPAILKRIKRLLRCGLLDRGAHVVLESLGKQTYLTEVEEGLLSWLENYYGVV